MGIKRGMYVLMNPKVEWEWFVGGTQFNWYHPVYVSSDPLPTSKVDELGVDIIQGSIGACVPLKYIEYVLVPYKEG